MRKKLFAFILSVMSIMANAQEGHKDIAGKLMVFYAGSLAVPFKQISDEFKKLHPGLDIQMESAGSRDCARKIRDLKRPCDVLASADYLVIEQLLIPDYADWNICFAANEMVIAYNSDSRKGKQFTADNWFDILMSPEVAFGRSNPDADPCGYRAVLTIQLAEKYYKRPGLTEKMLEKDLNCVRPQETDLLALLEVGAVDYIFLYRSVAAQHKLKYLLLPDQINLKKTEFNELYKTSAMKLSGKNPGESIIQHGEPIIYGITIPKNAPNLRAAEAFVKFILSKEQGMAIIEKQGQPSLVPMICNNWDKLPPGLRPFATKKKETDRCADSLPIALN
jgi:molybdate/tungstate transport system substrate-binding protein